MSARFQTLIAEDNAVFRQSLKSVLERRFPEMSIEEAEDGEQAVFRGTASHHDLIFMDIKMPGRNGLDATRIIKSRDHEAVVCLCTSYDLPEYRDAAGICGADHFIVKDESSESVIVKLVESVVARRA
jgi:two-component system response regulator YesN